VDGVGNAVVLRVGEGVTLWRSMGGGLSMRGARVSAASVDAVTAQVAREVGAEVA
jgi:hypothetical protein